MLPPKRKKQKEATQESQIDLAPPNPTETLASLDILARDMVQSVKITKHPMSSIETSVTGQSSVRDGEKTEHPSHAFVLTINKDLASKITSKYHNMSLLQLYRTLWDCLQNGTFQHIFTSSSRITNDLKHGDWDFEEKMRQLSREAIDDADLLVMRFFVKQTNVTFKKEFFLILDLEQREESVQEKLKRISMRFSTSGKTMELEAWKNYVALSKTSRDKVIMYAILLLGRVRDVTPKVMRKAYGRYKILVDTLLNNTRGARGALSEELAFFQAFKKKDREVALLVTAWILFESHQREKAQNTISEILYNSKPSQQLAFIYFTKARIQSHDPDAQIKDYTQCIDLFPIFPMAFVNRANLYHTHLKDAEHALADLESAKRLDPSWSAVYLNRGVLHKEIFKNYEDAQQDYNVAISCDPQNAVAYFNRALLYCDMGRYHMALVDFNKALGVDKHNALYFYNRAYTQHHNLNEYEAAMQDYNAAVAENPSFVEAYFHRGLLYMQHEAHEEALEDFSRCLELDRNFVVAYYYRSLLYGTDEMALRDLDEAITRGGQTNVQIVFARASLYEALGMFDQALKEYNSCLLLSSSMHEAMNAKERLANKMREDKERRIPREDAFLGRVRVVQEEESVVREAIVR